jgi:peptidoglycan/LPS O-acetylase OafA/YrhL
MLVPPSEKSAACQNARLPFWGPASQPKVQASRISFLESIRGLAATQVLLLHFFAAFVPDLVNRTPSSAIAASIHLSPLYFLYDGYSAVFIFFTLSGYVLTRSFERQPIEPRQVYARAVRLGLPALVAVVAAAALMLLLGRANVEAGRLLGNAMFSRQWDAELSISSIIYDGTINAIFLGYRDMSGLAFLAPWQRLVGQSFVSPLWTLSIEFYGSIAILLLCWCARRSQVVWWTAVALGAAFTIRSAYICFIVGHLLAVAHCAERPVPKRQLLPAALAALGVGICVGAEVWQPEWLVSLCSYSTHWLFPGQQPTMQQKAYGAILLLIGGIQLGTFRDFLSKPWLVARSRLSFPLYLVHWPIICGPAAALFICLDKIFPTGLALVSTLAAGITASFAASVIFAPVDRYAVGLSVRLRSRDVDTNEATRSPGIVTKVEAA